ncbi:mucin-17 [Coccinella septempunctata]|uniref:mucin-17 n=1 Tax=Coccinella septempunctata TaxID=41139 RepID=UPI001D09722C|nr:mucin-17 [Coccinella septempunctata]
MQTRNYGLILGSIAYFSILRIYVEAGPARSRRLTREVYPEIESDADVNQSQVCIVGDLVYGSNEAVPSEQPCLKCKCQPPGVQCEALRCANKKPGCKMVHRQNECCPDYQCECEYKGRLYSNGERLETSLGDECKVCYCRGGEIKCADVSCYVRNDCEGKQVPGQCCPKYDHCPTRDSLEKVPLNVTFSLSSFPDSSTPEETPFVSTLTSKPSTNDYLHASEDSDNKIQPDGSEGANSLQNSKITIQEIIPEILEIPITSNPKEESKMEPQGQLIIEETKATEEIGKENDLFVTDSEGESSELTEVIQSPPPVIRIGDNLLYLKKNELVNEKDASSTPSSIITLIGAEGLQRGGFEEVENNTSLDALTSSTLDFSSTTSEDNTNDLVSASSSHILSLVKKKKKPSSNPNPSTPTVEDLTSTPSTSSDFQSEAQNLSSTQESSTEIVPSSQDPSQTPETMIITEILTNPEINITDISITNDPTMILELENQNPAYPTQPDTLAEDVWLKPEIPNQTEVPKEIQEKKFKILPEILEIRNNKTVPTNTTHIEWLKENSDQFTPLINLKAALPPEILNAPAESDREEEELDEISTTTSDPTPDVPTSTETSELGTVKAENLTELINTDTSKSVETLEDSGEYSGEQTTSVNNAALTANEDASVADDSKSSEVNDMLFVREYTIDLSNDEEQKRSEENISSESPKEDRQLTDVEMIDVEELQKNNTSSVPKSPEKLTTNRTLTKRENVQVSSDAAVFAELEQELGLGSTEKPKTPEEEDSEARKIFQELLEETNTPKSKLAPGSQSKEAESLEKVGQALAKLAFKGSQPLDAGVLRALRDFFSSQYKAYEKNAK